MTTDLKAAIKVMKICLKCMMLSFSEKIILFSAGWTSNINVHIIIMRSEIVQHKQRATVQRFQHTHNGSKQDRMSKRNQELNTTFVESMRADHNKSNKQIQEHEVMHGCRAGVQGWKHGVFAKADDLRSIVKKS